MSYTEYCDLFGSINEDGINLVIKHLMRQRPSLFNYGTDYISKNPNMFCEKIDSTVDVQNYNNPMITVVDPLPVIGTLGAYGLDFIIQLNELKIDFHKGNLFELPPQLNPLLSDQHFAIKMRLCGGIGCPLEFPKPDFIPEKEHKDNKKPDRPEHENPKNDVIVLHPHKLDCFCLDLFVVGHFEISGSLGNQYISLKLDGFEIVDIEPEKLENSLECYIKSLIHLVVLPKLSFPIKNIVFNILDMATVTLFAIPPSAGVPNNPSIDNNELKVFIGAAI